MKISIYENCTENTSKLSNEEFLEGMEYVFKYMSIKHLGDLKDTEIQNLKTKLDSKMVFRNLNVLVWKQLLKIMTNLV